MKRTHEEDERGMVSIEGSKAVQCCGSQKMETSGGQDLERKLLENSGDP